MRRLAVVAAVAATAGCGGSGPTEWAAPQGLVFAESSRCGPLAVRVDYVRLRESSWVAHAGVENRGAPVAIGLPHAPTKTYFGIEAFRTADAAAARKRPHHALVATRFAPPLPSTLDPGERWLGSFSGPGRVPRGAYVRVVLGRFTPRGYGAGHLCVSDRAVRTH